MANPFLMSGHCTISWIALQNHVFANFNQYLLHIFEGFAYQFNTALLRGFGDTDRGITPFTILWSKNRVIGNQLLIFDRNFQMRSYSFLQL